MRRMGALALILAAAPGVAAPPATVVASAPRHVAVTVYRNPSRGRNDRMDLRYLGGFALVTETRTVRLPRGDAVLRFEGVAGGIVPASAIVTGLPGGTIEKNRDARLLSPASLVDGSLGRRIALRRTDRASGRVREEEAVIVAGPVGGVVVRTAAGVEALGCSGLAEKPVYPRAPEGLSALPTLSVTTRSSRATTARVMLSYLAADFDWSASYVATLAPDGRTLDLFAWMTLANGNAESFAQADVQAVAGRLERRADQRFQEAVDALRLQCYPLGTTTSDLRAYQREEIVVTASRRITAMPEMMVFAPPPPAPAPLAPPPPEDVGDLKLYRVPMPVTVAANQQKQVALLARPHVPYTRLYRVAVEPGATVVAAPTRVTLRVSNRVADGLGIPLPAGSTALYGSRGGEKLLLGTGAAADTAEGERFDLDAGISRQVLLEQHADHEHHATAALTNANPFPVTVEARIGQAGAKPLSDPSAPLLRIDGIQTWMTTIPANGRAVLAYGF